MRLKSKRLDELRQIERTLRLIRQIERRATSVNISPYELKRWIDLISLLKSEIGSFIGQINTDQLIDRG